MQPAGPSGAKHTKTSPGGGLTSTAHRPRGLGGVGAAVLGPEERWGRRGCRGGWKWEKDKPLLLRRRNEDVIQGDRVCGVETHARTHMHTCKCTHTHTDTQTMDGSGCACYLKAKVNFRHLIKRKQGWTVL